MSNELLFQAGLFCLKEAVYNVLLEASHTGTRELSNSEITKRLGIQTSFKDSDTYTLLRGVLDELRREERVERSDKNTKKMIWRIAEKK